MRLEIVADPLQQAHTELLVRHFAAAKTQRDLCLVAFTQEPDQIAQLDLVVAFIRSGTKFDLFDLDLLQLESRLVLLLGLTVFELTVVHDAANRRFGRRRDLHEIEFRGFCLGDGFRQRNDAELLAFFTYQSDFRGVDLAVDPLCSVLGYRAFSK
jgi:hypothetical protein